MNENVVMMCFHWFYSYVLVIWTQYFSQFFTSFFKGLRRICSRAKVGNLVFIICSLPIGTDCVTDKSKGIEWKLHFLEWKTRSFVVNLFCTTLKIAFWSFQISNFSGEAWPQTTSPPPPTVSYSIQTCWLLQFLLKTPTSIFKTMTHYIHLIDNSPSVPGHAHVLKGTLLWSDH